jgi:septal ring factor EnvC (AmiA/AmiB activator)
MCIGGQKAPFFIFIKKIDMNVFKNILLVLVIVLVVYNLFTNNQIKTNLELYNHKIDSIQHEVDSINKVNDSINNQIAKVDGQINMVENKIKSTKNNITVIKQETNEKVNAVNDFTIHDLFKFFSDRYENGFDTSKGHNSPAKSSDSSHGH